MKIKYSLIITFLVLAILLSGCSGITTPATDEAKIKGVINEYALAINDQNWSKAKSYCVYGSDVYYATYVFEDGVNTLYQAGFTNVTILIAITVSNVTVNGNYASAYVSGNVLIGGAAYYNYYSETESISKYYYLQKVGNNWKLY